MINRNGTNENAGERIQNIAVPVVSHIHLDGATAHTQSLLHPSWLLTNFLLALSDVTQFEGDHTGHLDAGSYQAPLNRSFKK